MIQIKKYKWLGIFCVVLTSLSFLYLERNKPVFFDDDVKRHYHLFEAKYTYSECRVWIDYSPQRSTDRFDPKTYEIIQKAILQFNKFLIYSDDKDFGGAPGIHLAFADFCEQSLPLAQEIAKALMKDHPDIYAAQAIAHTSERDHYDTGDPFMPYLDLK